MMNGPSGESRVFLTPTQLAQRWQVDPSLLANWRYRGVGPPYVKIGHAVRYPLDEVLAYEDQELIA